MYDRERKRNSRSSRHNSKRADGKLKPSRNPSSNQQALTSRFSTDTESESDTESIQGHRRSAMAHLNGERPFVSNFNELQHNYPDRENQQQALTSRFSTDSSDTQSSVGSIAEIISQQALTSRFSTDTESESDTESIQGHRRSAMAHLNGERPFVSNFNELQHNYPDRENQQQALTSRFSTDTESESDTESIRGHRRSAMAHLNGERPFVSNFNKLQHNYPDRENQQPLTSRFSIDSSVAENQQALTSRFSTDTESEFDNGELYSPD